MAASTTRQNRKRSAKTVHYGRMHVSDEVFQITMARFRQSVLESAMKSNAFLCWALGKSERMRRHFMDQSVELDMILEYMEPYDG
ncbi:hypothetical protein UFOVP1323_54 [uncultured Caudovirales phage]|uniref:Uncharacterized protein n=1 Tax=uncultured Caudovirales phage TaxID=2100421 RepID=A0A6J5RUB6_9CAUD|nr:hypothetical protein UFOVP1323_54 [uncultured Caudovirales phage]